MEKPPRLKRRLFLFVDKTSFSWNQLEEWVFEQYGKIKQLETAKLYPSG
jgi:hypothetical protein